MKIRHWILLFANLLVMPETNAQVKYDLDSLQIIYKSIPDSENKIKTLSGLFNALVYSDAEQALKYAREELALSEKLKYTKGIADGFYHIGVYHSNTQNQDSAKLYYLQASEFYVQSNNLDGQTSVNHGLAIVEYAQGNYSKAVALLEQNIEIYTNPDNQDLELYPAKGLAMTYDLLGQINMFQGNHEIALKHNMEALRFFDEINEPVRKADALNHVAAIEFYLHNFEKSISYNKEAYEIYQEFNDKLFAANALNDIGNAYYYLEDYSSAIDFLNRSLGLSQEMNADDLAGTAMNNLGKVYSRQGKFQDAIVFFGKALKIHQRTNAKTKVIESLNDLGITYNEMKLPEQAINYFNQSIMMATDLELKESLKIGYFNRSNSYSQQHKFEQALNDFKAYKATDDSIFSATKSQQIEELRTIYETENKEKEIALQKTEIQLLRQKNEINKLQRTLLGGGFGLTTLIFALGFYGLKQKIQHNRVEREKLDAELEFKKKELTSHALHLAQKNKVLEELKQKVRDLQHVNHKPGNYKQLLQMINFNLHVDDNWDTFRKYFEEVHKDFNSTVKKKYPAITANELRLMALMKLNLSSKEIANLFNITQEGIKKARYRLRKKMNISSDESLDDLIINI